MDRGRVDALFGKMLAAQAEGPRVLIFRTPVKNPGVAYAHNFITGREETGIFLELIG